MTIGEKIYTKRKELNLTQEELASKVNTTRQAVSKWELNEAIPDTDKLNAISKALNISVDELLNSHVDNTQEVNSVDELVSKTFKAVDKHKYKSGYYFIIRGLSGTVFMIIWLSFVSMFYKIVSSFDAEPSSIGSFINILLIGFMVAGGIGLIISIGQLVFGVYLAIKDLRSKNK